MSIFLTNALKQTYDTLVCLVFDRHSIHAAPLIFYNGICICPKPNMYNKTKITDFYFCIDIQDMIKYVKKDGGIKGENWVVFLKPNEAAGMIGIKPDEIIEKKMTKFKPKKVSAKLQDPNIRISKTGDKLQDVDVVEIAIKLAKVKKSCTLTLEEIYKKKSNDNNEVKDFIISKAPVLAAILKVPIPFLVKKDKYKIILQ